MDSTQTHSFSSLSCELSIIKAKNIVTKSSGALFIRCYLPTGNNTRVKLESHEIPSNSNSITWNQTFSLDCLGSQGSFEWLKQETIIFELRWKSISTYAPFIGLLQGSKLIARAEVPWKNLLDSTNMKMERWFVMIPENGHVHDDVKPPAVKIAMKVQEYDKGIEWKKINLGRRDEGCGCVDGGCKSCLDYEFFAIEAALEAL